MNPQNPQPPQSPEQRPDATAEQLIGTGTQEQAFKPAETPVPASAMPQNSGQPAPPKLTAADVAAAVAGASSVPSTSATPTVATPSTANDQDLIEPEWVAKAEQAVQQTAGNPHAEEEAVEELQVDYLKKRYGHEVGKPEDK